MLASAILFQSQGQNTIEVSVTQFASDKGTVRVGLYNSETKFLDEGIQYLDSVVENKSASVTFTDVPDGVYAISCYHDKDDNGELNMFMGLFPTERYGTSNNPAPRLGPPLWKDAKFEVKDGEVKKLDIKL